MGKLKVKIEKMWIELDLEKREALNSSAVHVVETLVECGGKRHCYCKQTMTVWRW